MDLRGGSSTIFSHDDDVMRQPIKDKPLDGSLAGSTESTATTSEANSLMVKSTILQEALQPALNLVMTSAVDRRMLMHAMIADGLAS